MFIIIKKKSLFFIAIIFLVVSLFLLNVKNNIVYIFSNNEHYQVIDEIFKYRNELLLSNNSKELNNLYAMNEKYGKWAYEHELKKMECIHKWANKQGVVFKDIKTKIKIKNIKEKDGGFVANFIASTEYKYTYENEPKVVNFFRIGTYHSMRVEKVDDVFLIKKEWYTDPFADSLQLDNINQDDIKAYILNNSSKEFNDLNERRKSALEYADKYCGAAADEEYEFKYNNKYKDYNPLGGDCANFASQILYEGANFKKTNSWNYDGNGSKAWVNAHAFKDYMLYSGRASLVAYGDYNKVYKLSYKLLPGDFVAYEKKGKVTHISVITGSDSKGYSVVNCHNTDRYRVPWDLGWSDKGLKFWLVHVNY